MSMNEKELCYHAIAACRKWLEVFRPGDHFCSIHIHEFAAFTGDPTTSERNFIINIENPEVMKIVDIILGPNGYTLLKMWKAQQDGSICNE